MQADLLNRERRAHSFDAVYDHDSLSSHILKQDELLAHAVIKSMSYFQIKGICGKKALLLAATQKSSKIVEYLLQKGAPIHALDDEKRTPLHLAAFHGCLENVHVLLQHGAIVDLKDRSGETPLTLAKQNREDTVNRCQHYKALIGIKKQALEKFTQYIALEPLEGKETEKIREEVRKQTEQYEMAQEHKKKAKIQIKSYESILLLLEKEEKIQYKRQFTAYIMNDPILYSTFKDTPSYAEHLVSTMGDHEIRSEMGNRALFNACETGNLKVVKILLQRGVHTEVRNEEGMTPLHLSIQKKQKKIVRELLAFGAEIHAKNKQGKTAIDLGKKKKNQPIIDLLMKEREKRIDQEQALKLEKDPISRFIVKRDHVLANSMAYAFSDNEIHGPAGKHLLLLAAKSNCPGVVKILLQRGVIPNITDGDGNTPLHFGAMLGYEEVILLILEYKGCMDVRNNQNETPSDLATMNGHETIASFLFKGKENRESVDPHFLLLASKFNCPNVVKILLKRGLEPSITDKERNTPLHYAAMHGFENVVLVLLEHKATVNAENNGNETPIDLAAVNGHGGVVKILQQADTNKSLSLSGKTIRLKNKISQKLGKKKDDAD